MTLTLPLTFALTLINANIGSYINRTIVESTVSLSLTYNIVIYQHQLNINIDVNIKHPRLSLNLPLFCFFVFFFLGGASASPGVRAELGEALEDGHRAGGGGGCPDHAREGGGVRAAQCGHVAGARTARDVRERAKSSQQGEEKSVFALVFVCVCIFFRCPGNMMNV